MTAQPDRLREILERVRVLEQSNTADTRSYDVKVAFEDRAYLLSLLRERDATITRLEQEHKALQMRAEAAEAALAEEHQCSPGWAAAKNAEAALTEMRQQIEGLEQENKAAETRIEALCQAHEAQFSRAESAEAALVALRQRVERRMKTLERLRSNIPDTNTAYDVMSGQIAECRELLALLPDERPTPPEER